MSKKTFLTIHGLIYLGFAVGLFFFVEELWPLYGMQINDKYAKFLSQHNSIFLGGVGIISLLFKDMVQENKEVAKRIFLGLFATNLLGFVITLYACINGVFTGFGWSDPAFFAFLAVVCFLYLKIEK